MLQAIVLIVTIPLLLMLGHRAVPRPAEAPLPAPEALTAAQLATRLRLLAVRMPRRRDRRLPRTDAIRRLRRLAAQSDPLPALDQLRDKAQALLLPLMSLRSELRRAPRLPADETGRIRMQQLAEIFLQGGGTPDAPGLAAALAAWQEGSPTTLRERQSLPVCMRHALALRLQTVLGVMARDLAERRRGERLARRMSRARRPMSLLSEASLTPGCITALHQALTAREKPTLLAALDEHLAAAEDSPARAADRHAARQAQLSGELSRILTGFTQLSKVDWPAAAEPDDPLHRLLLEDPAAVYPRMDDASRALYRRRAADLSRLLRTEETRLTRTVLALCREADADSLEQHVGWYLLEHAGQAALRQALHTRRGAVTLLCRRHAALLWRTALTAAHVGLAILWLEARRPMLLLPAFLGVSASLTHAVAAVVVRKLVPPRPLPRIDLPRVEEDARTLIVIPAVVHTAAEAVPLVRRMLLARKALPEGAVDVLLLADYADCLTQTSSADAPLSDAIRTALAAVDGDGGRYLYLHRRRAWSPDQHAFIGRDRRRGALEMLHRLIVTGECADALDAATVPPGHFHGRYAFTLVVDRDVTLAPDSLQPLLGAMIHPLNERRATPGGMRGVSLVQPRLVADPTALRTRLSRAEATVSPSDPWMHLGGVAEPTGVALCRPAALLEATDGLFLPEALLSAALPEGALAGGVQLDAVTASEGGPLSVSAWLHRLHRHTRSDWQLLPWLLSHVRTPGGVRRNPLSSLPRLMLRQRLRRSLLSASQLTLALYAALSGSDLLVLLALLAPELTPLLRSGRDGLLRLVERTVLLPLRAAVQLDAIARTLWRLTVRREHLLDWLTTAHLADAPDLSAMENWSQAVAAAGMAACALVSPFCPAGLAAGGLFALFPFLHPHLDAPAQAAQRPTADEARSLAAMASATWQFFAETVTDATAQLPPESLQVQPDRGPADATTPADIALYLLACLAAAELELIAPEELCRRVDATLRTLRRLPLWHGLPYRRYTLSTLQPDQPPRVDSAPCGLLCACLIALAQGLRNLLPHTPERWHALPGEVDDFARGMELARLYDPQSQLFVVSRDPLQPAAPPHHDLWAGESLLLSYVAVMRREIPLRHLARLNRTMVRTVRGRAHVSRSGSLSEYLLPRLLLPVIPGTATARSLNAAILSHVRHGAEGLFGLSESSYWGFDAHMRYRQDVFGQPGLALDVPTRRWVIAPYAAALCLPLRLKDAHESLLRLQSRGMLTRLGFSDALDLDPAHLPDGAAEARVECHRAAHQGALLCAVCNALTAGVLTRHFASVPEAAAFAPLLDAPTPRPLTLPARLLHPAPPRPQEESFRLAADPLASPLQAHLIGHPEALLLINAQGSGSMRARGVALTRFTGDPTAPEGIRFTLRSEGRAYCLTDPALPGDVVFSEGCARFTRQCGEVQCALTALVDPLLDAFIHVVDVTNPTGRERTVEVADRLIPALEAPDAPGGVITAAQPRERLITLTRRSPLAPPATLCHVISTHEPLVSLAAETACADGPCAGFRATLRLPPRGRAAVLFVTRLMDSGERPDAERLSPRIGDVSTLLTHARLLSRSITDSLGLTQQQLRELTLLTGALLWHNQPHQGALTPLTATPETLAPLGVDPAAPLLLLMLDAGEDTLLLRTCADGIALMRQLGQRAELCVLCQGERADAAAGAARSLLSATPLRTAPVLVSRQLPPGVQPLLEAHARLILHEAAGTLTAQLKELRRPLAVTPPAAVPADAPPLPDGPEGIDPDSGEFVLRLAPGEIPASCAAPLTSPRIVTLCAATGLGPTFCADAAQPLTHPDGETVWLTDEATGATFPATPAPRGDDLAREVRISPAVVRWRSLGHGLDTTLSATTLAESPYALRTLRVRNLSDRERRLRVSVAVRFVLSRRSEEESLAFVSAFPGGAAATHPAARLMACASLVHGEAPARCMSSLAFAGSGGVPQGVATQLDEGLGTVAVLDAPLTIRAGGSADASWVLGACRQIDEMERLLHRLRADGVSGVFRQAAATWAERLRRVEVSTPSDSLNLALNRLLPWQLHAALPSPSVADPADGHVRLAPRLQLAAALLPAAPELLRQSLLLCARHQYPEGDVQRRWSLPCTGERTRRTGDRLYLPLAAAWYVAHTGDAAVLQEPVPWLDAPRLPDGEEEQRQTPAFTAREDTLLEHCLRALTSLRLGDHGLPLMHGGDRDDGLDRVRGESVWLALFYVHTLRLFAPLAPDDLRDEIDEVVARLTASVEQTGWDGAWYRRAFFADGAPLGSAESPEYRIDAATQSWAVLALGVTERTAQALEQAWQQLYDPDERLLHAFAPPFRGVMDAGSAAMAPTDSPQNGGPDPLAGAWMLRALAESGLRDRAWTLLDGLLPHQPDFPPDATAAAWLYRTAMESLLGLEQRGDRVRLRPCVPAEWEEYTVVLRRGGSEWRLTARRSALTATCDGSPLPEGWVTLADDGARHQAEFPLR